MTLIDTSAWVAFFRGGGALGDRVDELLATGDAALCGPVLTELRRGLRTPAERARVLPLLSGCTLLASPVALWEDAGDLGFALARKGLTVKSLDLLIAVHALAHGVPLLTGDADFELIAGAGFGLQLAPR